MPALSCPQVIHRGKAGRAQNARSHPVSYPCRLWINLWKLWITALTGE